MSDTESQKKRSQNYLLLFLKGMAMGAADSVPGVSGGTIAVITRIYDELIFSIRSVDLSALRLLLSEGIARAWQHINGTFLLVLACGILLSLRLSAEFVLLLLENHFEPLMAFFIGLVIASAFSLRRECGTWNVRVVCVFLAGMGVTLLASLLTPYQTGISLPYLFFCGAVAICAMILPGLSGAFLLLILGVYNHVLTALVNLDIVTIVVFAGGAACGLMAFSRLLAWTLQRYRELTYGYLTGMLVASVTVLWPWQQVDTYVQDLGGNTHALETHNVLPTSYQALTGQDPALIPVLLSLVAGFVIITGFEQLFRNTVD